MHGVVHGFKAGAGGHGPVTHHGDGPRVQATVGCALRNAKGYGKAGPRVACGQGVVWAFSWLPKAGQAALQADVLELVASSRHQLVGIGLVGCVPDYAVGGTVEDAMQRQRELHYAQVGCQMASALGYHGDDSVSRLLRNLRQLLVGQRFQVARFIDSIQNTAGYEKTPLARDAR